MTVGELMHLLACLPPETQVRVVDGRLIPLSTVHTLKLRAGQMRFLVCVLSTSAQNIGRAAERTQEAIDAAEANRGKAQ